MFEILMTANVLFLVVNAFYLGTRWEKHRAAAALQTDGEPK